MKEIKKLLLILDRKDKKSLFILATLLLISLFFEILGIGIIVPVISFFLEGEIFLPSFINFPKTDKDDFILYLTLFIVLLYILKTIFLMVLTLKINRFIYTLSAKVSNKIFSNILNQEYFKFISKNSSEYVKTLQNEMSVFTAFLVYLLTLIVEGLFIIIILFTIVIIEPTGTLLNILILGLSSIIFLIFFDKKLKFWGQKREEMDKKLFLILNSTFGGIKEITLLNRKPFFENYYSLNNFIRARVASNNQAVSQFPRVFLEFIAVFSIITFVLILKFLEYGNELIITKLSVFAFASFKILPSTSKIINAIQHLKYYSPSVEIIYRESINKNKDLQANKKIKADNNFSNLLIKNLLFYYNKENILFKNFSFQISKGDWVGIIGPSGSGKSTLIDLISGLIKPISGEILIDNLNISKISNKENFFSYVPQNVFLSDDSIINNIALGIEKEKIDLDRINKVIKECELEQKILNLPNGLQTKVGERGVNLSGGQLQRIGIARALYTSPKILILDEATSALDLETEAKILNTLKKINKNVTILMIAHRKETLINCNSIIDLHSLI